MGPLHQMLRTLGFECIQVSYHGQTIVQLCSGSAARAKWMALRSKLIAWGFVAPFARVRPGMVTMTDPVERAMVAPFRAHRESTKPARWLSASLTSPSRLRHSLLFFVYKKKLQMYFLV